MSSLVSVIIATYNSSTFVLEALESIKKQTWENIELIITDDCSIDNSVDLCTEWLNKNGIRFSCARILKSDKNTGVSANANRGLNVSKGEWIKFIGADDVLLPDCIKDNMQFINENPESRVVFSHVNIYSDTFDEKNLLQTKPGTININSILWPGLNVESQYRMLLLSDRIHFSPSVFLHRQTLISIGGFDERFRLMEDYPIWLNLTRNGHKLFFLNKLTVNYRQHSKAINNTGKSNLIKQNYFRTEDFRKIYTYPNLPFDIRFSQKYIWLVSQIFRLDFLNINKLPNRFLLSVLTVYLNPFRYYIYFKKLLNKNLKDNEFYL